MASFWPSDVLGNALPIFPNFDLKSNGSKTIGLSARPFFYPLSLGYSSALIFSSMSRVPKIALLSAFCLFVIIGALAWGAPIPLSDLWSSDPTKAEIARHIFLELRPPRAVAALLVGASLAVAGAGLQTMFGNPLAEPYLLGISAGGALGATASVALQLPPIGAFDAGALLAFVGALATALTVYVLGQTRGESSANHSARLLLIGVAISALLSSLMSLIIALSGRLDFAQQVSFWLLGSFGRSSWPQNVVLLLAFITGTLLLLSSARDLNALRAGADDAAALGVEVKALHRRILIAASLLSAASVAAAGLIGFIGLLAPHIVRLLGARDVRALLPASALGGATLLVACDALARGAFAPIEIPVGIVTALLGVPLFLSVARRM